MRAVRIAAEVALALALLVAVGIGGLAWRLSSSPFDMPWLARSLEAAATGDAPVRLSVGSAVLTWEGFHHGTDQPLKIRLLNIVVSDPGGGRLAVVPRASVSLSPRWLLQGRLVPRRVEVEDPRLRLIHQPGSPLTIGRDAGAADDAPDTGGAAGPSAVKLLTALLRELARPPSGDSAGAQSTRWSQLREIGIRGLGIEITDRQLGGTWHGRDMNVDLARGEAGGLDGTANGRFELGGQTARLALRGSLKPETGAASLSMDLSAVNPARLAAKLPAAAMLAGIDLPVAMSGTLQFDPGLKPASLSARVEAGAGSVTAGGIRQLVQSAVLTGYGTQTRAQIQVVRLEILPRPDGPATALQAHADITRLASGAFQAAGTLDLDQIDFADLPAFWPVGTGGRGTRPWITGNIPEGNLHDGHLEVGLEVPASLDDASITRVAGGISGDNVLVHWLRPAPPLEKISARLTLNGMDGVTIDITGGRLAGGAQGGMQTQGGRVVINGFNNPDQFLDIEAQVAGPVPDLLTLLRHPRVKLLDRSPMKVNGAAGQIAGKVFLTRLPLRDAITMDDVNIRTSAKLTGLHLTGVVGGRDLDDGALTLEANPSGLTAAGTAQIASIPADLKLAMDFRHGPPAQVLQSIQAGATLDAAQLAALGLDMQDAFDGQAPVTANVSLHRDGRGEAVIHADLAKTTLTAAKLSFTKPAGTAAQLDGRLLLEGGKVTGVDKLKLAGPGLTVEGDVSFINGVPDVVHFQKLILGRDNDAHGEVHVSLSEGEPWMVALAGRSLNASALVARGPPPPERIVFGPKGEALRPPPPPPGPPYMIDAKFDRVVLAEGRQINAVDVHIENDGSATSRAHIIGRTGDAGLFQLDIGPLNGVRTLTGSADDTGALLQAFGVIGTMVGGKMTLTGNYDDSRPDRMLTGTLEIADYRIRNAPILGRMLQGMTLYGLLELVKGPGLGFTRLVAPFHLAEGQLELVDARTYSASLGITAKGFIDLPHQAANLQGTIVPAYFFNSLLGNMPLVGQIFSPEKGGGLLAASYAVRGKLDNPDVSLNPLSALTPGFLRQMFGGMDNKGSEGPPDAPLSTDSNAAPPPAPALAPAPMTTKPRTSVTKIAPTPPAPLQSPRAWPGTGSP